MSDLISDILTIFFFNYQIYNLNILIHIKLILTHTKTLVSSLDLCMYKLY